MLKPRSDYEGVNYETNLQLEPIMTEPTPLEPTKGRTFNFSMIISQYVN